MRPADAVWNLPVSGKGACMPPPPPPKNRFKSKAGF